MHSEFRVISGKFLFMCIAHLGWEPALPLLNGRQQRHRLSISRHPFYDPYAVSAVFNAGLLGLWGLWRLLKGKLTRRKICGLLYFLLAPLGKHVCHEALAIRLQTKIHPQNPHLSVCVWCPMLLAGVSSTAHGDLCGWRSKAHSARTGAGRYWFWSL